MLPFAVVIRTFNEGKNLERVLNALEQQSIAPREAIIVDNESTDGTLDIARSRLPHVIAPGGRSQIVTIPRNEFSHPKSMNLGMAATSCPVVLMLVGHAIPIGRDWAAAAVRHFDRPEVAGVYAHVRPDSCAGIVEGFMYEFGYQLSRFKGSPRVEKKVGIGVFGATNIAIRREMWAQHAFDEGFGSGGEDSHWATWALEQHYQIICDLGFSVRHSHGLNVLQYWKQVRAWQRMGEHRPFNREQLETYRSFEGDGRPSSQEDF
jgi:glycosyltransferase involved in cell wall biosynthesis